MLRAMRDGARGGILKYILFGFLVLAAGGLVLTDVGGFFRGGVSSNMVAEGSGVSISTVEFDKAVRRVLAQQGFTPDQAYRLGLINSILQSEIQQRLLNKKAKDLGIRIGDEVVTQQISMLAEPLAQDGMSKTQALQRVLRAQGISEAEFIQAIRMEMANTLLRNGITASVSFIPDSRVRDYYQIENESRSVKGFLLDMNEVADFEDPSEEQLQAYYEANTVDYMIPERRSVTIATLKREMLESKVDISDEEIRQIYEDNIAAYRKPEQRRLKQAVLNTLNDAEDILSQVKDGSDLKKAVNTVTGSNDAYLGEDIFQRSGLLEEISEPVFEAGEGDVIGPVQSALGWHVLVLTDIIEPQTTPLKEVKGSIRDELLQTRLMDELIATANSIDDQLAGGADLNTVAEEIGLTTEAFKSFTQAGISKDGKNLFEAYGSDSREILDVAFDYLEGETSPVMELEDGRFIAVRVDNIEPQSVKPYEEIKDGLRKKWISEQQKMMNQARANDAMEALKGGTNIKDVAAKYNVRIRTFSDLTKGTDEAPDPLTAAAVQEIFATERNKYVRSNLGRRIFIGQITEVTLPDPDQASEEDLKEIRERLERAYPQNLLELYVRNMVQNSNVKINSGVLDRMYGQGQI